MQKAKRPRGNRGGKRVQASRIAKADRIAEARRAAFSRQRAETIRLAKANPPLPYPPGARVLPPLPRPGSRTPLVDFLKAALPRWNVGMLRGKVYWEEAKGDLPHLCNLNMPRPLQRKGNRALIQRATRKRLMRRKSRFPRRKGWRRRKIRFHWQKKRVDKTLFLYVEFRKRFHNGFKLFRKYAQAQWREVEGVHPGYTRVLPYLLEKKKKSLLAQKQRRAPRVRQVCRWLATRLRTQLLAWTWKTLLQASNHPLSSGVLEGLMALTLSKPLRTFFESPLFHKLQESRLQPEAFEGVWNQILNNLGCHRSLGTVDVRTWKKWISPICALSCTLPSEKWATFQKGLSLQLLRANRTYLPELTPMLKAFFFEGKMTRSRLVQNWAGADSLPARPRQKPLQVVAKVKRKYLLLQGAFRKFQGHGLEIHYARPEYGKVQIEYKKIHLLSKYRPLPLYYLEVNYNTLCFSLSSGFDFLFYPHRTFLDFRSMAYFYAR